MPKSWSIVRVSCSTITDAKIATGSSIALKIDANPPPTFGIANENNIIGKITPNRPSARPYFHSPALSCPFQMISGDKKMLMTMSAIADTINVRVIVVTPVTWRALIWIKIEKLSAAAKPNAQPCQGIDVKSTSKTPAAKIVPVNKNTREMTSILVGRRFVSTQFKNNPIHVNWNNITTASEAGK